MRRVRVRIMRVRGGKATLVVLFFYAVLFKRDGRLGKRGVHGDREKRGRSCVLSVSEKTGGAGKKKWAGEEKKYAPRGKNSPRSEG